jgi:hypothetical protein
MTVGNPGSAKATSNVGEGVLAWSADTAQLARQIN